MKLTDCHVQDPAGPHNAHQAVNVLKDVDKHLRLGAGGRLQAGRQQQRRDSTSEAVMAAVRHQGAGEAVMAAMLTSSFRSYPMCHCVGGGLLPWAALVSISGSSAHSNHTQRLPVYIIGPII